jgi:hypothetical protein
MHMQALMGCQIPTELRDWQAFGLCWRSKIYLLQ